MTSYLGAQGEFVRETVIRKSRFITRIIGVESEEDAVAAIAAVRKKHSDATHNCYAYIADETGLCQRFSDDGEPSGTAGLPMLEVLKKQKLFEVCVAVVRYFGGIKLGAGGLVRAYSSSVSQTLAVAQKCDYVMCRSLTLQVEYPEYEPLSRFLSGADCQVSDTAFSDRVRVDVMVKSALLPDFLSDLRDRLLGRVEIFEKEEYFYPFPIDI